MLATVRRYAGLGEAVAKALGGQMDGIASVLGSVPGVRQSQLIRTRDGVIVVTVGADEACLVEHGRRFRAWMDDNVPGFRGADEADVWVGSLLLDIRGEAT